MKIEHSMLIWFHISDVFSTFFFSVFKQHKSRIQVDCKWRAIMPLYFLCFSVALPSYSLPPLFFQSPVINDRAEIKPSKASHWANTGKQLWAEHRLKLNGTFYESSVNHATRLKTCKNTSLGLNATWGTIKGTYTDGTLFLGKVLAVVDGKALLMVSNQSARSEVFFFFLILWLSMLLKREPGPSITWVRFCCCHGEWAVISWAAFVREREMGTWGQGVTVPWSHQTAGKPGPRATADPHTAHKERHTHTHTRFLSFTTHTAREEHGFLLTYFSLADPHQLQLSVLVPTHFTLFCCCASVCLGSWGTGGL